MPRSSLAVRCVISHAFRYLLCLVICLAAACSDDGGAGSADAMVDSPPNDPPTYAAMTLPGGLDRIVISKADPATDTCTILRLVSPVGISQLAINLPQGWGAELSYVKQGYQDCAPEAEIPQDGKVVATVATGSANWTVTGGGIYPTTLAIDAAVGFPEDEPWTPMIVALDSANIAVMQ